MDEDAGDDITGPITATFSRPDSPHFKDFLKSLDEEFDKQRVVLYAESVGSDEGLSESSASHSVSRRLPSFYEVEKASKLCPPIIPKWDVVPKLNKLDKMLHKMRNKKKSEQTENSEKDMKKAQLTKRSKITKKLAAIFRTGWSLRDGLKATPTGHPSRSLFLLVPFLILMVDFTIQVTYTRSSAQWMVI